MSEAAKRVVVRSLRDLDALIAEKVLGWYWDQVTFVWDVEPKLYLIPSEGLQSVNQTTSGSWGRDSQRRNLLYDMPSFSTSIADAWQVVEYLRQRYATEMLALSNGFMIRLFSGDPDNPKYTVRHESAPIAICLAALRTKGVEVVLELTDD